MLKAEIGRLPECQREGAQRMPSQLARNGITFLGRPCEMKIHCLVRTALEPVLTDARARPGSRARRRSDRHDDRVGSSRRAPAARG